LFFRNKLVCSYDWIRSSCKDSATVVHRDLSVTGRSPNSTPLVLDENVLFTIVCTPTDGKDTVIKSSTATGTTKNTCTIVRLESSGASGNTDRDWLKCKGGFHWFRVICSIGSLRHGNVFVGGDGTNSFGSVV